MDAILSVGYSGKLADLKQIINASGKVKSVYTGGVAGLIAGGRPQYVDSLDDLQNQIDYAHARGIAFELAINAPCGLHDKSDKTWWHEVKRYLKEIETRGIDSVTVSHPFIMNEVKAHTNMKITVSTICEVMTARAARYYEDLGGNVIVPSMNINMQPGILASIKASLKRAKLRIMVNEHCLGDCPWRRFHHNHYAHSMREIDYHLNCKRMYLRNPFLLLANNVIRPEDIHRYRHITNDFKIVGRLIPPERMLQMIWAYSEEKFDGNFVELCDHLLSRSIFISNEQIKDLIQKKWACSKICDECGYCQKLFERAGHFRKSKGNKTGVEPIRDAKKYECYE